MYNNKQNENEEEFSKSDIFAMCIAVLWIVLPYAIGILTVIAIALALFSVIFVN